MLIATIPIVVMLFGLLILGFGPPKATKIGEIMFFCGLFVALLVLSHKGAITLFP
jgi:drug/metabolite transporter (DMT)-like permease